MSRGLVWVFRIGWAVVPFTAGPALGAALHHHASAFRTTATVGLWTAWALALGASLVSHPISLTLVRAIAPGADAASVLAAAGPHVATADAALAVAWTALVTAVAFGPAFALPFVNGPAYPNERRFPLSCPGLLLLGPLELAWALSVGLPATAALALAAQRWVLGGITTVLAIGSLAVFGRALHGLSRRWVVFVPAGVVLHDPLSLVDPVLFMRALITRIGPAAAAPEPGMSPSPETTPEASPDVLDLTQHSPGLAIELVLREEVPLVRMKPGTRSGQIGATAHLTFRPSRPGSVLAEAAARHLPVA